MEEQKPRPLIYVDQIGVQFKCTHVVSIGGASVCYTDDVNRACLIAAALRYCRRTGRLEELINQFEESKP